jgi:hypothetical protein
MGFAARESNSAFSFAFFQRGRIEVGDLKEQLESGLRPRSPAEFAYVQRVVELTRENKLPLKLVKVTFNWARRKRPYPFPYFQRALTIELAKRGIRIR